jgi:hypothetical protein
MTLTLVTLSGLLIAFLIDRGAAQRRPVSGLPLLVALGSGLLAPFAISLVASTALAGGAPRLLSFAVADLLLGYLLVVVAWGVRALVARTRPTWS